MRSVASTYLVQLQTSLIPSKEDLPAHAVSRVRGRYMRRAMGTWDYFALTLMAGVSIGCGGGSGTEPSGAVDSISVVVKSSEWTAEKSLMVVGENAFVEITPLTSNGCPFPPVSGPPVYCPTPAVVQIRSSNSDIIGPAEQQVSAPASVTLVARGLGTADLTVRADTVTRLVHLEVSSEPLPLDAIQIFPVYDASPVTSAELGVEGYAAFRLVALRSGAAVYGLPLIISSSPSGIVYANIGCPYTRLWPQCWDNSRTMTMEGLAPGDTQVTVTGRNVVATLNVHVPSPAASSMR